MNAIRSILVFTWMVITVIPMGLALVLSSLVLDERKLWWWFAVPWLKGVIWETFYFPSMTSHPLAYVFKQELLRIPIFGWCMGRVGMIHIDRSKRSEAWARVAEQGRVLMDRGKWVIMFPEGTRTERGRKGEYKTGATRLAVATGAYVIPIAVTSGRCWPRRSFSFIPGVIDVSIGEPVSAEGREAGELMDEVERWIEAEMRRLDPEAYN